MNNISIYGDCEEFVKTVRDRMAFRIDTRLVNETPALTTQARTNWLVTRRDITTYENITEKVPKQVAIDKGASEIAITPAFTDLYIVNNVPYIVYLAEGSSDKNPTKFVELIVESEARK